jgi:hypothetical protein
MKCDVKDCPRAAHAGTWTCREHLRWAFEHQRAQYERRIALLREEIAAEERAIRSLEAVYREKMRVE